MRMRIWLVVKGAKVTVRLTRLLPLTLARVIHLLPCLPGR